MEGLPMSVVHITVGSRMRWFWALENVMRRETRNFLREEHQTYCSLECVLRSHGLLSACRYFLRPTAFCSCSCRTVCPCLCPSESCPSNFSRNLGPQLQVSMWDSGFRLHAPGMGLFLMSGMIYMFSLQSGHGNKSDKRPWLSHDTPVDVLFDLPVHAKIFSHSHLEVVSRLPVNLSS